MATSNVTRPETTTCNPHCESPWPNEISDDTNCVRLTRAGYGASVIVDLLLADRKIATDREEADDPGSLPLPFTEYTTGGLWMALQACIREVSVVAEILEKRGEAVSRRGIRS